MKGLFIDRSELVCTRPAELFSLLGDKVSDYNWLICDLTGWDKIYETYKEDITEANGAVFIKGEKLMTMMKENRLATANWAVFSAFDPSVHLEDILSSPLPASDFNKTLWFNPVKMLHPLAKIEIVISEITDVSVKAEDTAILELYKTAQGKISDLEHHNDMFTPPISEPEKAVREKQPEKKGFFSKLFGN